MNGKLTLFLAIGACAVAGFIVYRESAAARGNASGDSGSGDSSVGGASGAAAGSDSSAFEGLTSLFSNIGASLGIVAPKGERNNNPGNIRYVASIQWQGQTGDDGTGYAVFDTPENGIRALGHQLRTDINRGQNTVALIIGGDLSQGFYGYAPPNENNTIAYINDVSQRLGVDANQSLDQGAIPALAQAMIIHEEGEDIYGIANIAAWSTES